MLLYTDLGRPMGATRPKRALVLLEGIGNIQMTLQNVFPGVYSRYCYTSKVFP